jgi:Calreticulin family
MFYACRTNTDAYKDNFVNMNLLTELRKDCRSKLVILCNGNLTYCCCIEILGTKLQCVYIYLYVAGLQTTQDARFYAISAKFDKPFTNEDKTLVIQFSVKHEQEIDCGGGYVKVFPSDLDQKDMHGDSPYNIMFGPDICGYSTKKVHVIFNYKGKNLLTKKDIRCKVEHLCC